MVAIQRPICAISGSRMPRLVSAGVPMRTPEVTNGFWGSKGTAFLLQVSPGLNVDMIDLQAGVVCWIVKPERSLGEY